MRPILRFLVALLTVLAAVALMAQNTPLTVNPQVRTDSNGYLLANVALSGLVGQSTPLRPMSQTPMTTDSNGYLLVNIGTFSSSQLVLPVGSAGTPSLTFTGRLTDGIFSGASTKVAIVSGGVSELVAYQNGVNIRSDGVFSFASTTDPVASGADTGLSRTAAGSVAIGTGAQGNSAGSIIAQTHITSGTTAVAVANVGANSCGTTAATIAGNENVGAITVGATSGTQCRITFTTTAATRRHCVFTDETTTIATRGVAVDTTHSDVLGAFVAGDVVSYVCLAR